MFRYDNIFFYIFSQQNFKGDLVGLAGVGNICGFSSGAINQVKHNHFDACYFLCFGFADLMRMCYSFLFLVWQMFISFQYVEGCQTTRTFLQFLYIFLVIAIVFKVSVSP